MMILDSRSEVYVSYEFWETTFCDHHLESSVVINRGNFFEIVVSKLMPNMRCHCPTFHRALSKHVI